MQRTYNALRPLLTDTGVYIVEDWWRVSDWTPMLRLGDFARSFADNKPSELLLVVFPQRSMAPRRACSTVWRAEC